MLEFLSENLSDFVWLAVVLVAMIPTLESKVAIPFGLAVQIWHDKALSPFNTFLFAFVGTLIPTFFCVILSRYIKSRTAGFVHDKFFNMINRKFKKHGGNITSESSTLKKCVMLASFVAVPLPLTGAYSGAILAGISDLKIWQGVFSVMVGSLFGCIIVLLFCLFFENSAFYLFVFSICFVVLFLCVSFLLKLSAKLKQKKEKR